MAARRYFPGEEWLGLIGLVLLLGALIAFVLHARGRQLGSAGSLGVTAVVFSLAIFALAAARVDRHQQSHVLLAAIDNHSSNPRVGSFGCLEPSWVYYGRRPITLVSDPVEFLSSGGDTFLITTQHQFASLQQSLPAEVCVLAETPCFLRPYKLLVLGHVARDNRTASRDGSAHH